MKKFCSICNIRLINTNEKYCSVCAVKANNRHKEYKLYRKDKEEQKFYNSTNWRKKREHIKDRDNGLCLVCLYNKEIKSMDTVHHIEELKDNWNRRYDEDNLISVCESCHQKIHKAYRNNKKLEQTKLKRILKANISDQGGTAKSFE